MWGLVVVAALVAVILWALAIATMFANPTDEAGTWVKVATTPHVCSKPEQRWRVKTTGSQWRCGECSQVWEIVDECHCPGACNGWAWRAVTNAA